MTLRAALILVLAGLAGCVSTGSVDPMRTAEGREKARDAYIQLGLGYLQQGAAERAKVPLRKALELDSSSADANAALALVFQTEMEPKLADEHYRKALSSRRDARILNNYGGFLFEQKRYEEALERFQEAAEDSLYPERSRVFENLGLTALRMKRTDQAKQYFDKSLRLNVQQPVALLEMASLSFDEKQYVPARDYYERYTKIAPQTARSLLLGVRIATVFDDRDQAASLGLQLKRLYPGTPEYQQYLSEQR
ncbi:MULTISPECIES: type IV pilus biogenesis/stability protein PilW [Pseudomonadaceae]|uniref:type IV pilus biogenesis/stability protein PilW n=1 Tax=Pseudomonadaceae TaxID=135621 RepID=UPI0020971282|nr:MULTISPECIES: type IV pilus biogenesis/stability protein PilW [Pseudomonas]MCO7555473.1 type IV pilus biogenesis/stability protein PilW [Pseudomonas otitidis]MDU9398805.1 type IV pilus biogenesis/stability protein PilW [Pseudomonas sp. zfem003]